MNLIFGYLAGLLTLINPCVLPVLPIVLATALQASKFGPVALALGMSLSFVTLGMLVAVFGASLGIDDMMVANVGAVLMIGFGIILLVPRFSDTFSNATVGFAAGADTQMDNLDRSSLKGQFLGGILLGAVWSPCVGPTLGGAISLASQGKNLWASFGVMVAFALGISTIILGLAYGARSALQKRQALMRKIAQKSRPILGVVFVLVGLGILFRVHHMIEGWLLDHLPYWFQDLSVRF